MPLPDNFNSRSFAEQTGTERGDQERRDRAVLALYATAGAEIVAMLRSVDPINPRMHDAVTETADAIEHALGDLKEWLP